MILNFKLNGSIFCGFNDAMIKQNFPGGAPKIGDVVDLWGTKYDVLTKEFVSEDNFCYVVQPKDPLPA
jgi:hypothetical protein